MKTVSHRSFTLHDHDPRLADFRAEIVTGLASTPKSIPCKFFYDQRGSKLFDRICELDEYYPTRTELGIMEGHAEAMADALGERVRLVEFGSGSSLKTRVLLDHLHEPTSYVPIDISRDHLIAAAKALVKQYPDLLVEPVCADYTGDLQLPASRPGTSHTVCYFPGSTVGNLTREEAIAFLQRVAAIVGSGGGLLIGADLQKDRDVLVRAYDDREGVTAAFNLNLLHRINAELGGDFDVDRFEHRAIYDDGPGRIVMQLISKDDQTVHIVGESFDFERGEVLTTEYSHRYTLDSFAELAEAAGFAVLQVWTDPRQYFSVQYLETAAAP